MQSLDRFRNHQEARDAALAEIRAGRKCTHWAWFVFPQIAGLSVSKVGQHFALTPEEAKYYATDTELAGELVRTLNAVIAHEGRVGDMLGRDLVKLCSCATLFMWAAAGQNNALALACAGALFRLFKEGIGVCARTISALDGLDVCDVCGEPELTGIPVSSGVAPVSYIRCLSCQFSGREAAFITGV